MTDANNRSIVAVVT